MKRAAILFTLFMIGLVVLADLGRLPAPINFIIKNVPHGDRVGHFVLFGLLNFFVVRAALSTFVQRDRLQTALVAGLILALLVAGEEYSQNYFAARTADWVDLAAGYVGMLVGGWVAFKRAQTK